MVTPLDVKQFELELKNHPNRSFVTKLLAGIREGFDIGYTGPELERASCNLKSARDHHEVVATYLAKECQLGRVGGAFTSPPFSNITSSRVRTCFN